MALEAGPLPDAKLLSVKINDAPKESNRRVVWFFR
jgi:hypothetical protein